MTIRSLRLWLFAFLLVGLPLRSFAALSAATVWECRASGASDNNGGGFVAGSGGTDRSQQNSAQVVIDNATITTSITTSVITFTGSTYTVLAGDVGNIVQMLTGTNVTAGFYQITSVSAGLNGTWTMDRNVVTSGTTTNATGDMGGALLTLGKLSGAMVGSNKAYCTGAFTSTATITFAQSVATPNGTTPYTRLIGYNSARGDLGMATLALSTNTGLTGIAITGASFSLENVAVDCGSLGTSTAISASAAAAQARIQNCKAANFTTGGIVTSTASYQLIEDCEATGGTSAATAALAIGAGTGTVIRNFIHDNACPGIAATTLTGTFRHNIIANNSGASSDGIQCTHGQDIEFNTIHNNGRDGIHNTGSNNFGSTWRNNILSNNGGFGINGATAAVPAQSEFDGNAYFSNTSGSRNNMDLTTGIFGVNPYTNVRDVILTGSPYVGPTTGASANFALNDNSGAGRSCRRAGIPSAWPGNTGTTAYPDMGAVQTRSVIRRPFFGF